eukprot:CAMPEP_0171106772 /NCGR_PEP_ID=MMETSP0766_2-20121228/65502_1 /TAXON_ID=439317 /ORGANISM="Gambierdiscus australes, Strain CAWD 149" /LENGTH=177 /DNA_ID=CAMNT_0011567949 /DNA_START=38 /DNA_END=571 /DNA_ORIENTATION=+
MMQGVHLSWFAAGAACGIAAWAAVRRIAGRRKAGSRVAGIDFLGNPSSYVLSGDSGIVGLLAYDVCEPLSEEEYDKWLFDIHYHDLMANPHLEKIVLHTVRKDKRARLSSGATVKNEIEFFRLAELYFADHASYDKYVEWFQANAVPPPRTPVGKSAFKFYLLSERSSIVRVIADRG